MRKRDLVKRTLTKTFDRQRGRVDGRVSGLVTVRVIYGLWESIWIARVVVGKCQRRSTAV